MTGRGAGASPPPAGQIMLAPNGERAFFELQNRHYLVEVPRFGKNTLEIKVGGGETPVPVREVAPEGGDHLAWSAASDAVVWSLGNTIYRQDAAAIGGEDDLTPDTFEAVVTEPRARPSGRILLKDAAQVLTMNGEEILRGGDVLVEDNRIAAVGADLDAPEGVAGVRRVRKDRDAGLRGRPRPHVGAARRPPAPGVPAPREPGLRGHDHPGPPDLHRGRLRLPRPPGDRADPGAADLRHRTRDLLPLRRVRTRTPPTTS